MTIIIEFRKPQQERFSLSNWFQKGLDRLFERAQHLKQQRNARRTARQLSNLPFDVRKDIGWPASDQADGCH